MKSWVPPDAADDGVERDVLQGTDGALDRPQAAAHVFVRQQPLVGTPQQRQHRAHVGVPAGALEVGEGGVERAGVGHAGIVPRPRRAARTARS
ncbi:MAG: hypothetical protein M5U09_23085 [Gammaproteobacteria bacterium]|nr:hypothetical protein [Gammaproteobacteria bacterium]